MRVRGFWHLCVLAAGLPAACRSPDALATSSPTDAPCAGGANVRLALLTATTLDCSAGTTVTLPGDGAAYLVAAQLASAGPTAATTYTISVPGSAVSSVQPLPAPARLAATLAALGPGALQAQFDAGMRARGAALSAQAAPLVALRSNRAALSPTAVPQVGSSRSFQVLSTTDFAHERYASVSARLAYAGAQVLLYVDEAAPAGGFDEAEQARFGRYVDEVLYPLDAGAFGAPTDIDTNGRLIMLLTPIVNSLTTRATCGGRGYIAGFFNPGDLSGGASSNGGEVFYGLVPDGAGGVSCAHTVAQVEALLPGTFLHEMQHLISYGQHVVVHHGQADAGWLDEGLSLVAEELGAIYYQTRYPGTTGRSAPGQLLPDSAEPFLANAVQAAYQYLLQTDTVTLTTHSDADPGAPWRGGDWLLLRWLGDQKGSDTFYRALEQTPATGIPAVEAAAGERFPTLFADFALALYADSLDAVPRSAIPARLTIPSRNLRRLLAAFGDDYPLRPVPLLGTTTATLPPGAIALYRVSTNRGAPPITLRFSTPAGAPLPQALGPQLSIFRLPGA